MTAPAATPKEVKLCIPQLRTEQRTVFSIGDERPAMYANPFVELSRFWQQESIPVILYLIKAIRDHGEYL